jgi:hypothetical protein
LPANDRNGAVAVSTSLERRLGPVDLSTVRVIAIDEFAIQLGHRYATVVVARAN